MFQRGRSTTNQIQWDCPIIRYSVALEAHGCWMVLNPLFGHTSFLKFAVVKEWENRHRSHGHVRVVTCHPIGSCLECAESKCSWRTCETITWQIRSIEKRILSKTFSPIVKMRVLYTPINFTLFFLYVYLNPFIWNWPHQQETTIKGETMFGMSTNQLSLP